jgi:N-acylneuraminate cytidylyltransferase
MKILALIAARGESKRIPRKNVRQLGDCPLFVWSINVAKEIADICEILVSTDDHEIKDLAIEAGALVPWLRPPELATDTARSVDVCLHALDWYEGENGVVDGLLLLQPTSPFRRRETVLRGIDLFRHHQRRSVIGVSPAGSHPMWCFKVEDDRMRPFVEGNGMQLRSQDLPSAYKVNGAFYLTSADGIRRNRSFYADDSVPLVMEKPEESIDIDTEFDWQMAETVIRARKCSG